MAVYRYTKKLILGDIDKTTNERHLVSNFDLNTLERNYLHKIQERFHELGFGYMVGNINGCFNTKLFATILAFQSQAKSTRRYKYDLFNEKIILVDVVPSYLGKTNGVFDKETSDELSIWLENNYRASCDQPLIKWGKTWIRANIAEKIEKIKKEVKAKGAFFATHNIACFRNPANTTISTGMKKTSLHLAALAIDLDEWRGMQNSKNDYYFISDENDGYWDIYLKKSKPERVVEKEFTFYDFEKREYYKELVSGDFINLTNLFKKHGLIPIRRRNGWENEYYLSEWWHFQDKNASDDNWKNAMNEIGYLDYFLEIQNYIN